MTLFRSLRVRLTAVFVLLASAAAGIAATVTVLLVEQVTLGTLDAMLLEEATTLANLSDVPGEQLAAIVRDIGAETDTGRGKFVRIARADGSVLAASRPSPASLATRPSRALVAPRITTAGEDESIFRVAWAPTPAGGSVAVGVDASRNIRFVQRTQWAVGVVAGLLLAVLGFGAWSITGRATREIDRLAAEVATIEAGSLARRLSARRTDEVDRLVTVFNRVLERLERSVAQLRRFTADAAHELRTPLAAMRARLETALYENGSTVPREPVVDALEQAERLGRLAEDLLTLARVEGGAVGPEALGGTVDLSALVEEVATAMGPVAEEQGRPLRWNADPGLEVSGSEPLLRRVLLNLVDNALRHTPATAPIEIAARRERGAIVLDVCDGGPGVDPTVQPHLFERFRHGQGGGSGLGLALAREIVERHGGTVTLDSPPSGGTRARVVLPANARLHGSTPVP